MLKTLELVSWNAAFSHRSLALLTISHRPSLFKHHKYLLRFTEVGWEWSELGSKKAMLSVEAEIRELESKVGAETMLQQRINAINALLGVKGNATKK